MFVVIGKVISIFSLILIGYIANRMDILSNSAIPVITNLMMYITAPCMLASSIYSKTLSRDVMMDTIQTWVGTAIFYAAGGLAAYVLIRLFRLKPKEDHGALIVAVVATNSGFMGFPITKAVFGNDFLYLMAMSNVILNVFMMGISPSVMNVGTKVRTSLRQFLKSICNILMLSIAVGLVMLVLGVRPPAIIDDIVQMLSDATIPISMILVGMQLGSSDFHHLLNRKNVTTTVIAMAIIPVITFLVVNPMPFLSAGVKLTLVFMSVLPTAVMVVPIAEQYNKNSLCLAEIVSLSTLVSIVTIPLAAAFLMSYYL